MRLMIVSACCLLVGLFEAPHLCGQGVPLRATRGVIVAPEAQWHTIDEIVAIGEGRALVLDRRERIVGRISRDHPDLVPLSREGDGPGEIREPTNVGRMGQLAWITDSRLLRIVSVPLLGGAGATLYSGQPVEDASPGHVWSPVAQVSETGSLWIQQRPAVLRASDLQAGTPPSRAQQANTEVPVWILSPKGPGRAVTTLVTRLSGRVFATVNGRQYPTTNPLPVKDWLAPSRTSSGFAVVRDRPGPGRSMDTLVVEVFDQLGRPMWERRFESRGISLARAESEAIISSLAPRSNDLEMARARRSAILDSLSLSGWPQVTGVFLSTDESIWIRRPPSSRDAVGTVESWWRVRSQSGVPLEVELPDHCTLRDSEGDTLWMACDPDINPQVVLGSVGMGRGIHE